jgi:hypothetical protein
MYGSYRGADYADRTTGILAISAGSALPARYDWKAGGEQTVGNQFLPDESISPPTSFGFLRTVDAQGYLRP